MINLFDGRMKNEVLEFLVQCHRIAPNLTSIQIAILFVLHETDGLTREDIARKLSVSDNISRRAIESLIGENNSRDIVYKIGHNVFLTDRGKRYCRSLEINSRYFLRDMSSELRGEISNQ